MAGLPGREPHGRRSGGLHRVRAKSPATFSPMSASLSPDLLRNGGSTYKVSLSATHSPPYTVGSRHVTEVDQGACRRRDTAEHRRWWMGHTEAVCRPCAERRSRNSASSSLLSVVPRTTGVRVRRHASSRSLSAHHFQWVPGVVPHALPLAAVAQDFADFGFWRAADICVRKDESGEG